MIGQKKFSLKNNSVEYFLELWGWVLQHFWGLLEKMMKSEFFCKKLKNKTKGQIKIDFKQLLTPKNSTGCF